MNKQWNESHQLCTHRSYNRFPKLKISFSMHSHFRQFLNNMYFTLKVWNFFNIDDGHIERILNIDFLNACRRTFLANNLLTAMHTSSILWLSFLEMSISMSSYEFSSIMASYSTFILYDLTILFSYFCRSMISYRWVDSSLNIYLCFI